MKLFKFLPFFILFFALLSCLSTANANVVISGEVRDSETLLPVEGVLINLQGTNKKTVTGIDGRFELLDIESGYYDLSLEVEKYASFSMKVSVESANVDLGVIQISPVKAAGEVNPEDYIPTILLTDDDLNEDANNQNISGVLTASRDVFVSAAAFTFGPMRFRIRGLDSENTLMSLNGIPMNDLENGRVFWSIWSGLNDVTRNRDTDVGLGAMGYTFGGLGGGTIIDTRASTQRRQKRFSYSHSNRSYRNRLMGTYSTGWLKGDWAISLSGSHRWAEEGYIEGTFYDAWSYFLSVDKKLGEKHLLNLTTLGAPVKRGRSGGSTQELYDLAGTNYYNPYWGYQNGEKRNSRVVNSHQPMTILRHDWTIDESSVLTTSLGYQFGYYGSSALDWFDAPDPRPDYYRYLPSFLASDSQEAAEIREGALRTDEVARQINWDQFYFVNRNSQLTEKYDHLLEGKDYSGNWSQYIIENRRFDTRKFSFNSNYQNVVSDHFTLSMGLTYQSQKVRNYKIVDDLLGGDFYVNVDRFAIRDSVNNQDVQQFNLDNPSQILKEGDAFGWDFDANINRGEFWAQGQWTFRSIEAFLSAQLSQTNFWRTGNVRTGRFPDNSLGDSEKQTFNNYGLKGGLTYKISGRHYLYANGAYLTRAPFFRNSYVSPRTRDQLVPGLESESILSGEAGYYLRSPGMKARATVYYAHFENQVNIIRFYNDLERAFGNYIMSDVSKKHIGTELAIEAKLNAEWTLSAVAALGQFTFDSRATGSIYQDNQVDAQGKAEEFTIYNKNFNVPGGPRKAYTFGINYNSPKYWFANLNFNYFDDVWMDFNPLRRTSDAVLGLDSESQQFNDIISQEKTDPAFTIDFFGGKSFKFNDYYLYLNLGVNNILNEQNFITGGYEQLRFEVGERDVDAFPNRYFYSYGANFFANVSLRF